MGDFNSSSQATPSRWGALWDALMARKQLQQAAGPVPSTQSGNQDTSTVQRAAEEAGRRNEAEKKRKRDLISVGIGEK